MMRVDTTAEPKIRVEINFDLEILVFAGLEIDSLKAWPYGIVITRVMTLP
jgi:hypothetical protein